MMVSVNTINLVKKTARAVYNEMGTTWREHPTWQLLQQRFNHDRAWEISDQESRQLFVDILTKLHSYPEVSLTVLGMKTYNGEIEVSIRTWEYGLLFIDLVIVGLLDPAIVNPPPPSPPLFNVRRA